MKKMIVSSTLILSMTAFIINFCACGNKAEDATVHAQPVAEQTESQEQRSESIPSQEQGPQAETRGMSNGQVVELSSEAQFDQLVGQGNVLVDFFATWCPPCKKLSPVIHDLAQSNKHITFIKIDTDKFPSLSSKYNVKGLPTLIFLKNGSKVYTTKGAHSKEELQAKLREHFRN